MKTSHSSRRILVLGILLMGILPCTMYAPAFMKLEGVDGEATDTDHKDWVIIQSISMSISYQKEQRSATFGDMVVIKEIDKSTPKLMESCATGNVIPSATLVLTRPDAKGGTEEYCKYVLTDVIVTSFQTSGSSGDEVPIESMSLNFSKVEVTVLPLTGDPYPPFRWDLETNSAP